ncbi:MULTISPECIES: sugar-binding transcriptional regulator [Paracoccus]|jgi:DNA-binding transcriptional regulator LsrR (DeoR family)|uniref:Sugar-binding transcriptional regulator n=1 Tax=Paracoccus marcusii TaxID=59779 RepID=A0ABY7URG2_9RHOB|nr:MULTISPECIES: sugar-binding transcriptional regulator [Paracoccus]MCO6363649.1 sugar-binding transcriptional regulator [Paracoccus sp. 08]TYP69251.1 DNA-binding transcriptional regulator LsrR (DeoR family) [Stutzerimonas stutzeri]WDA11454.1 sugar-binding transcriptional regulator [Paracoccus marcusii]
MARRGPVDPEQSLAIRAAWLHYAGGLTQAAVAKRLGLPGVKAHRLIARAVAEGVVKVTIDGEIVECAMLEDQLCARYGLDHCEVAPDLGEDGMPLRALGLAGAGFLRREIERGAHRVIGLGHGRTLAAAVRQMPRFDARAVRFVAVLGGLTRNYAANPHDVMHTLAEKTGAQAFVMPVPFFANSEGDRAVLLSQPGVRDIFDLSNSATLTFVGMGTADAGAQLVASGMIEAREIAEINAAGGVGEMMGYFFDATGRVLDTTLSARTLSVDLNRGQDQRIVVIAGGAEKVAAIRAVLNSGRLSGLITDEATARALMAG